jgi:hypothetical protein
VWSDASENASRYPIYHTIGTASTKYRIDEIPDQQNAG